MRRYAILLGCGLALMVLAVGCKGKTVANTPEAVADKYFELLRELKFEDAKAYTTFESEDVEQEWDKQMQTYADLQEEGGRKWWGDALKAQKVSGRPPGEWAIIRVQWRFQGTKGWMMGPQVYEYNMRTVDGQWKMVMSQLMIDRGIPFHHPDTP